MLRLLAAIKTPSLSFKDGWGEIKSIPDKGFVLNCFICNDSLESNYDVNMIVIHGKLHLNNLMNKFSIEEILKLESMANSNCWWKIIDHQIVCNICNVNIGDVLLSTDIFDKVILHGRRHIALISFS